MDLFAEEKALARRALACDGWHWLCGMFGIDEAGTSWVAFGWAGQDWLPAGETPKGEILPDLDHGGTRGQLLELVRRRHRDQGMCVGYIKRRHPEGWYVWNSERDCATTVGHCSEAEALVAALEAAP